MGTNCFVKFFSPPFLFWALSFLLYNYIIHLKCPRETWGSRYALVLEQQVMNHLPKIPPELMGREYRSSASETGEHGMHLLFDYIIPHGHCQRREKDPAKTMPRFPHASFLVGAWPITSHRTLPLLLRRRESGIQTPDALNTSPRKFKQPTAIKIEPFLE